MQGAIGEGGNSAMRRAGILGVILFLGCLASAPATWAAPKVTAGTKATDAEWSSTLWSTVAIVELGARDEFNGQTCAGTLIDDDHVLTAAHCVAHADPVPYRDAAPSLAVKPGFADLWDKGLDRTALIRVSGIFVNPNFNPKTMRWDVAVLRLARPVTEIPPVAILSADESASLGIGKVEREGVIAGWGDTDGNA